ncbi:MAG TPA: hypothetical protein DCY40_08760 [Actinobacteria bacterium]|nr:hypothetical protein [Actinomycetota bacterium]
MLLDALFPSTDRPLRLGGGGGGLPSYLQTRTVHVLDEPRQAVAGRMLSWQVQAPHYTPATHAAFVHQGFRRNAVFRRCVDLLASSGCQAGVDVIDLEDRQSLCHSTAGGAAHPGAVALVELIRRGGRARPVPGLSGRVLMYRLWQDLYVYGNALWEKVRSRSGRVVELWRLDPRYIAVEPDPRRGVKRYLYNAHGKWWPIELSDVIHLMHVDPEQQFFGVPPIYSAMRDLQVDNELVDLFKTTLENFAVPPAVLEVPGGPDGYDLDDGQAEKARQLWKQRYGRKRRGDVAVLPPGVTVKVIGMDFQKLAIGELSATSENRVAMVHGVPMILLGRSGTQADPTRANYGESKEHFWLDTIVPMLGTGAELLSLSLVPEFVQDVPAEMAFRTNSIGVLQAAKLRRAVDATKVFEGGVVSRHVAQQLSGVEQHGPDVFYRRNVDGVIDASATIETLEQGEL